jgi:Protein of unknown function (DUF3987)
MTGPVPFSTSQETPPQQAQWPDPPAKKAFHGLAGEIVRVILPHSEADPVALLAQLLTMFGNVIGRSAHFVVESTLHAMNLFVVLVGKTSRSRKGTSKDRIAAFFEDVDQAWLMERNQDGLSSGEGLIWNVRDQVEKQKPITGKGGRVVDYQTVIDDHGIPDKRLLVIQPEFASMLQVMSRNGNTLSTTVRRAWETGNLQSMTKNSPAKATGAHISIVGHITVDELRTNLNRIECSNGFANRFLFCCVARSTPLPEGGNLSVADVAPFRTRLLEAVNFARGAGKMKRNDEAKELWKTVYGELTADRPGLLDSMTARAEAQVTRLSCIYALLDQSAVVREEHLNAALALWSYTEASVRFLFGDATGDPVADQILQALRKAKPDGLSRTDLSAVFARHKSTGDIDRALAVLAQQGLARREDEKTEGRPVERWFAV